MKTILNLLSFVDVWLFKFLAKKNLILFCDAPTYEAPEPIDVYKAYTDYSKAIKDSLPNILDAERTGRPEFAKLNLADTETYLFGGEDQRGLIDLTRAAGEQIAEEEIVQKERDLDTLDRFGDTVAKSLRGLADPDADRIAKAQADQAISLFEAAKSGPTPEQQRQITQGVLQGTQASQLDDPSVIANQFLARDQFARMNRAEAREAGRLGFAQAQELGGDPLKFLFGDPSQALRYGTSSFQQGLDMTKMEQGPRMADYDQGVNLALQDQANQMSINQLNAQSQSSGFGDLLSLGGSILGATTSSGGSLAASILGR